MVISLMAWTNSVYVDIACVLSMLYANIVMWQLIHHYALEFNFQHLEHAYILAFGISVYFLYVGNFRNLIELWPSHFTSENLKQRFICWNYQRNGHGQSRVNAMC